MNAPDNPVNVPDNKETPSRMIDRPGHHSDHRLDRAPEAGAVTKALRRCFRRLGRVSIVAVLGVCVSGAIIMSASPAMAAGVTLNGAGSSFAGPEISQWTIDTAKSPYNLNINFTSSSSSDGRFEFANQTINFGVTDIEYQPVPLDTTQPTFPFIYVPVTAGGLAFMYHLNGFSGTLQLSSYSACAIFTGGVTSWNSPIIQADNPGVTLPDVPITPVVRSDLAGTNFVFQEWCLDEQPALWAAFVNSPTTRSFPGQVGDLSATAPRSDWPLFQNATSASGSAAAADTVANPDDNGYITAVETAYALQRDFPVASVKNKSGDYTQPTAVDVASALAYATQLPNGTHVLNFNGTGPHVYNPSTYSYLLSPTTGSSAGNGAVLSQFVNYALTLGQHEAPEIGYASLGLSLEQYGVNQMMKYVPGAVAPTAAENQAYACGDLTPAEVQAGQTTITCGVTNATTNTPASTTPSSSSSSHTSSTTSTAKAGATGSKTTTGAATSAESGTSGLGGASAGVTLSGGKTPLAYTGGNPVPTIAAGAVLFVGGAFFRRRHLRARHAP
jgi:phosphate transport system substrate-binding protein